MRIMITGGGTGGHTSPALAIVEELRKRDPQLLLQWVGRKGGIEERVATTNGIPFRPVPVAGWPRKRSLRQLWVAFLLALGVLRSFGYLRAFRPQVVIGVGGYVCLPAMVAAQQMGIATMLHEQNRRLGMANRLLAPKAYRTFLSFEDSIGAYPEDRARLVGNPVRAGFLTPPEKSAARALLELDPALPVILVTGGSQGAASINGAIAEVVQTLAPDEAQVIWMTGRGGKELAKKAAESASCTVQVRTFIDDMVTACAAADLMICRSGASTTAELAVLGMPAILVPYPFATDDHQTRNAEAFSEAGAAELLPDGECTGEELTDRIRALLSNPNRVASMSKAARTLSKPLAAESVVEEIMLYVFGESDASGAAAEPV